MSQSDKATRDTAVPFVATPYGVNIGMPNQDDALQIIDFLGTISPTPALRVMRLAKPERGNLIQAYLNLFMTVNSSLTAKVAIGRFDTDGLTPLAIPQYEIDDMHKRLTGTTSPIASVGTSFVIDGLNLLSLIPKKGEANYNADGFILIVQFSRDLTTLDRMNRFEVACSMQMGLL